VHGFEIFQLPVGLPVRGLFMFKFTGRFKETALGQKPFGLAGFQTGFQIRDPTDTALYFLLSFPLA
jgi:hypothetical protein